MSVQGLCRRQKPFSYMRKTRHTPRGSFTPSIPCSLAASFGCKLSSY